jgi:hypothetical protein
MSEFDGRLISVTFFCPETEKEVTAPVDEVGITGNCESEWEPSQHSITVWTCPVCGKMHDLVR